MHGNYVDQIECEKREQNVCDNFSRRLSKIDFNKKNQNIFQN